MALEKEVMRAYPDNSSNRPQKTNKTRKTKNPVKGLGYGIQKCCIRISSELFMFACLIAIMVAKKKDLIERANGC